MTRGVTFETVAGIQPTITQSSMRVEGCFPSIVVSMHLSSIYAFAVIMQGRFDFKLCSIAAKPGDGSKCHQLQRYAIHGL